MHHHSHRLTEPNLVLIWLAQLTGVVAGGVFGVIQLFWLKEQTGSPAVMGAIGALALLPSIIARPFGGLAADRLPRRRLVVAGALLSGLAVLALALATLALPAALGLLIGLVALVAVTIELCGDFAAPALDAAVPDMVPRELLARANMVEEGLAGAGGIAGVVLGSALVGQVDTPALLLGVAAAYAVAGLMLLGVRFPEVRRRDAADGRPVWEPGGWRADAGALRGYLGANPGLLWFALLLVVEASVIAVVVLHVPFYLDEVLGLEEHWYGLLAAAVSAGGVAGATLAGFWSPPPAWRAPLLGALLAGEGVYLALAAQPLPLPAVLAISVLGGAHGGFLLIQSRALIEIAPPSDLRGRVLGLLSGAQALLSALLLLAGGWLSTALGAVTHVYLICGAALVLAGGALATLPAVRAFLIAALADDEAPWDAWRITLAFDPTAPAEVVLAQIEHALAAGRRGAAVRLLRQAADTAALLGDLALAERLCRRLVAVSPADLDARQQLVIFALLRRRTDDALAELWGLVRLTRRQGADHELFAALAQLVSLTGARHAAEYAVAQDLAARGAHREAARILRRLALLDPQAAASAASQPPAAPLAPARVPAPEPGPCSTRAHER